MSRTNIATPSDDRSAWIDPYDNRSLIRYFEDVPKWHGYIHFLSLPQFREYHDVPIWRLFVEPHLAVAPIRPAAQEQSGIARNAILSTLAEKKRLVILGDPGSGKSTLVNWIAWQLSRPTGSPAVAQLGPLIPLPMIVRDLALSVDETWDSLVEKFLERPVAKALDAELVRGLLESGQVLVLLDGLDELNGIDARKRLRDAVWDGMKRYPNARWILTSREVGYEAVPFDRAINVSSLTSRAVGHETGRFDREFRDTDLQPQAATTSWASLFYVAPFDERQIREFTHSWFLLREPDEQAAQTRAEGMLQAIARNPGTVKLAAVPNLLSLLAIIYRTQNQLPHGRTELYDLIAKAYLEAIDTFRNLAQPDEHFEVKKAWLARIAFQMQSDRSDKNSGEGRGILIAESDVVNLLIQSMHASTRPQASEQEAKDYLDWIARRSGLFIPRGPGLFAFSHLSFQEYFAAFHLAKLIKRPSWSNSPEPSGDASLKNLRSFAPQSVWLESLVILFELLTSPDEPESECSMNLAERLFGTNGVPLDAANPPTAVLLAEISVNPYSGLSNTFRENSWKRLLDLWIQNKITPPENTCAFLRSLFDSRGVYSGKIWEIFLANPSVYNLQSLNLSKCTSLSDIQPIQNLVNLQKLDLWECTSLSDIQTIQNLVNLQTLDLSECTSLSDFQPIQKLVNLRKLYFGGSTSLSDIQPLQKLVNLQMLVLSECTSLSDIQPLQELVNLRWLHLSGCTSIAELPDFSMLPNLKIYPP